MNTTTWISPWNGRQLTADELVHEVLLDAMSQFYIVSQLGYPEPAVSFGPDSLSIRSAEIDYDYVIYYPRELFDKMSKAYTESLGSLKSEFGLCGGKVVSGDQTGRVLQYFRSLERLVRMVSAERCWQDRCVLALHGLPSESTPLTITNELAQAGIHYLILYPEQECGGSGMFRSVSTREAISLVNKLWPRQLGAVQEFFCLERDYGRYAWESDNNKWVSE